MTAYKQFMEKLDILAKRLSEKPYMPVPDKVWEKPARDLDKLLLVLEGYYTEPKVPTKADIKVVKEHGITAQVKAFISADSRRKAFFKLDYFKAKCASLPDQSLCQGLLNGKTTKEAYLTTFLTHHYWKARPKTESGLEEALKQIRDDYQNSPAAKQGEYAKALYRKLLSEADLNKVVAVLQGNLPDKAAVSAFAKSVGLKIPSGKKPIHERLAAKILTAGGIVRASF